MDIRDIRINDMVQDKINKFPMRVVGIFADGLVNLDFEGNEGDVFEVRAEDLEPYEEDEKMKKEEMTKDIDWEQRRYETAKDLLCVMTRNNIKYSSITYPDGRKIDLQPAASAKWLADELILQLQKGPNEF